jgi:hypothetical protein
MIHVRYSAIDGYRDRRSYKTLAAARRYAVERVGEHPEFGSHYAVSGDGVGKVTVEGCSLAELFGVEPEIDMDAEFERVMREEAAAERAQLLADAEAYAAEMAQYRPRRSPGCRCSDDQLVLVGCDCGIEIPF